MFGESAEDKREGDAGAAAAEAAVMVVLVVLVVLKREAVAVAVVMAATELAEGVTLVRLTSLREALALRPEAALEEGAKAAGASVADPRPEGAEAGVAAG